MSQNERLKAVLNELADEHRRIMRALSEIETSAADNTFHARLLRLQRLLVLHFGHEQMQDGLYDMLRLWQSSDADEIARLVSEHKQILIVLDELIAGCIDSAVGPDEAQRQMLLEMVALIRDHELHERTLTAAATTVS